MGYSLQPHIRRQRGPSKPHTRLRQVSEAGLRFYSPSIGRWLSRDPIRERGGRNLYVFVGNAVVNRTDSLGLRSPSLSVTGSNSQNFENCGAFSWPGEFKLDPLDSLTGDGTIVQNMEFEIHVFDCQAREITQDVWPEGSSGKWSETFNIGNIDTWEISKEQIFTSQPCGTQGYATFRGAAQYYDEYYASQVNDPWDVNWEFGGDPQHEDEKPWGATLGHFGWQTFDNHSPSATGYKRELRVTWDCCGKTEKTKYTVYLGYSTTSQTP